MGKSGGQPPLPEAIAHNYGSTALAYVVGQDGSAEQGTHTKRIEQFRRGTAGADALGIAIASNVNSTNMGRAEGLECPSLRVPVDEVRNGAGEFVELQTRNL